MDVEELMAGMVRLRLIKTSMTECVYAPLRTARDKRSRVGLNKPYHSSREGHCGRFEKHFPTQTRVFSTIKCLTVVRHSDKSNEMSEKIKIELALVYYCPVHDQSDIFSILPIDKLVDFFMIFQSWLSYKEI